MDEGSTACVEIRRERLSRQRKRIGIEIETEQIFCAGIKEGA
jgi:hypothetical protein